MINPPLFFFSLFLNITSTAGLSRSSQPPSPSPKSSRILSYFLLVLFQKRMLPVYPISFEICSSSCPWSLSEEQKSDIEDTPLEAEEEKVENTQALIIFLPNIIGMFIDSPLSELLLLNPQIRRNQGLFY